MWASIKFIYSEKAAKFYEISILLLTGTTYDKSKVEILQNFVAFSEYMNFNYPLHIKFFSYIIRKIGRNTVRTVNEVLSQSTPLDQKGVDRLD